jgi:2-amino-4-hydroxy-6-hydroxymethyldihydropteridine diphosphokinase
LIAAAFVRLRAALDAAAVSSLYRTKPLYVADQPDFFNAAVVGLYAGTAFELLAFVNAVEAEFGRDRLHGRRRGERTLDIDILLFGGRVIAEPPRLVVPHPGLLERRFALEPLLELWPDAVDPRDGRPLALAAAALPDQGIYYAGAASYNPDNGNHRRRDCRTQFPAQGI